MDSPEKTSSDKKSPKKSIALGITKKKKKNDKK